jgi:4-hydroxybutyrate CoA-transferase
VAPDEAVLQVGDGARLMTGLVEPSTLLAALARREVGGTALVAVMALGGMALCQGGRFRVLTAFASPASRPLVARGACEYVPLVFSEAGRYIDRLAPDSVMVRLAPPDAAGRCSYGWSAGHTPELVDHAREQGIPILAEIDPAMPRTHSGREVPTSAIAMACPAEGEAASDAPVAASRHADAVARHLSPLVPDGATLQVGVGSLPDAAAARVEAQELGIHTEVLGPGLARLVHKGQATGARKPLDRGLAVCTIASMDPEVCSVVEDPTRAEVRAAGAVLDLAVDLRGQVNAETLGVEQVAGVGGQLDFLRGAGLREDALRIIALGSATASGESRIVAGHPPGTVVTATRYDIDVVVTEHGAAWLRDRSDEERARALIAVADPRVRAELERARFER